MRTAYVVVYEGASPDPDAFVDYYVEHHLPIMRRVPGVRSIEVHRGVDGADFLLMGTFTFDSPGDLELALDSEQISEARADAQHFPAFEGTMRRQVLELVSSV